MKPYRTVLFDNDGVLVDTERLFFEACRHMLESFGRHLTEEQFAEKSMTRGMSLADIIVEMGYSPEIAEEARQKRNLYYDEILMKHAGTLVIDGAAESLERLHARYTIGVVTCCQKMHFKTIHDSSGLRQYFDFVIGDQDFVKHKPDPEPYLTALARGGLKPEETIVVEDTERGILSAQRAGIKAVAIPRGLSLYGNFDSADLRFDSIRDFTDYMLN